MNEQQARSHQRRNDIGHLDAAKGVPDLCIGTRLINIEVLAHRAVP